MLIEKNSIRLINFVISNIIYRSGGRLSTYFLVETEYRQTKSFSRPFPIYIYIHYTYTEWPFVLIITRRNI